ETMRLKCARAGRAALLAIVFGIGIVAPAGVSNPLRAAGPREVSQSLRDRARQNGRVRIILELQLPSPHLPEATLRSAAEISTQRQLIAAQRARVFSKLPVAAYRLTHEYRTVPYVALEVAPAALDVLAMLDADVARVIEDRIAHPVLADSVPLVQGDQAQAIGFDGSGTTIAVLDTGVDSTHPFLAGKVVEEACYSSTVAGTSETFCPNGLDEQIGLGSAAPCPLTDCFHGTHVA